MMLTCGLPESFWALAVRAACYVRNRLISKSPVKKVGSAIPFTVLNNQIPDVGNLIPFGSRVYLSIPAEKQVKMVSAPGAVK